MIKKTDLAWLLFCAIPLICSSCDKELDEDIKTPTPIVGNSVTHWISDYMSTQYLWNEQFNAIKNNLAYDATHDLFLNSALSRMTGIDEDGYIDSNGNRRYYSYIKSTPKSTTRIAEIENNYGVSYLYAGRMSSSTYCFIVGAVYNNSPADLAGIKRGTYITKYNGNSITEANLHQLYYTLMGYEPYYTGGAFNLQIAEPELNENEKYTLVDKGSVSLAPAPYDANPILMSELFENTAHQRRIGYFVYSQFNLSHDGEIIQAFNNFKASGITDLILDLRYNPGGYVYSSTVLATLIAGEAYKGKVFSHLKFNASRTAKGEQDYFYIGQNPSMQSYLPISSALGAAVNLNTIYVLTTHNTASASELIINGLRGLGITVHVVGEQTNGKNVGMEVINSSGSQYAKYLFGNYDYEFAPITFYNFNAQGFGAYANGFEPTYSISEAEYVIVPWGDYLRDPLLHAATQHIVTHTWPAVTRATGATMQTIPMGKPAGLGGAMIYPTTHPYTIQ